jgi:hypothetical protein
MLHDALPLLNSQSVMTLVVGRIVGPRVAIVADTMLTKQDKPLPFQSGVVKSCMLQGDLCVSFSNSPDTAERAFKEFVAKYPNGASRAEVIKFFEQSSQATNNDYLVAFANPAGLVKIVHGKRINSISKTQWIGDRGAYSRFREYEARQHPRPEQGRAINAVLFADEMANCPASDLFSAMRNIVADRSIMSVGGFVSVISQRNDGFRFSAYSDMLYDWPKDKPQDYSLELTDQIAFTATDENASFAVAQVSPGFMNMNLVAFYFTSAKKLFFFYGKDNGLANQCQVFRDVPATQIYKTLNAFVRFDLKWLLLVTSPQSANGQFGMSGINTPGNQFAFFCDANTFPKMPRGCT